MPATTPREVAKASDFLVTMLPDSLEVREVYLGHDGAFDELRPGWLAIDMSSISPSTARELATRATEGEAEMLDAPVSGGDKGASAGTLSIMVGGPRRQVDDAPGPRHPQYVASDSFALAGEASSHWSAAGHYRAVAAAAAAERPTTSPFVTTTNAGQQDERPSAVSTDLLCRRKQNGIQR